MTEIKRIDYDTYRTYNIPGIGELPSATTITGQMEKPALKPWAAKITANYILDNLMHRIGLHGKSVLPLILGYGCSVPAIMATRM